VQTEAAPGTVRILGLGDSVMFGWGVAEEDSCLRQLERLLRERQPAVRWEVVVTAVPGYNTVMEVATLVDLGLALQPALVLLDIVGNDTELPTFVPREPDCWSLSTSFLANYLFSLLRGRETPLFRPLTLAPETSPGRFESDPARVPEQFRGLVGEQ